MRIHRLSVFAAAVAVVACSSQDSQAKGASAPKATAATTAAPSPAAAARAPQPPKTLKAAMKAIEDDWKAVEEAIASLQKGADADLAATETAARRVAQAMRFAYDPFEDKEVPNFATMAKEAEAALNAFADGCKQGNKAAVTDLGKTLQEQHCARCHDATEEAKG